MLLAVNLGNTNISFGVFAGASLERHERVPVAQLESLADRIGDVRFNQIALASVTPALTGRVVALLAMRYGAPVLLAGRDLPFGVETQCDDPDAIGADRLLNAVAAYARTGTATIVADVGTAVTVDLVSAHGTFCGGAIAAGPDIMLRALHRYAELLPEVAFERPPSAIGHNTADAMRSGAYWGTVGLVEGLVARIAAEQTGRLPVIITGGNGEHIANEIKVPAEFVPALTLEGLASIVGRNVRI